MRWMASLALAGTLIAHDIDDHMPLDVQKETGVQNLTPQQKRALGTWLEQEFKRRGCVDPRKGHVELFLSENINNGKFLRLSDDSLWEVDPIDISRADVWLFPFPVKIDHNGRADFPYTITNMNTGSKVDVRPVHNTYTDGATTLDMGPQHEIPSDQSQPKESSPPPVQQPPPPAKPQQGAQKDPDLGPPGGNGMKNENSTKP